MAKFERGSGRRDLTRAIPALPEARRTKRKNEIDGDAKSRPNSRGRTAGFLRSPPDGRSRGHVPRGALTEVKHDGYEGASRPEISWMLDRVPRPGSAVLTPEEHLVGVASRTSGERRSPRGTRTSPGLT